MRVGLAVAALCVVIAGALDAQEADWLGRLRPGQTVRVRTVGGSRFVARLGATLNDPVTPSTELATIPFQRDRVDSLWVRGHAPVTGALVGAAIATPASFLFWWWFCDAVSEGSGCSSWGAVSVLSLAGGAGGALIGAAIGAFVPKWRLRYARERSATVGLLAAGGRVGVSVRF